MFHFPPRIHLLRNIKHTNLLLGFHQKNNTYLVGLMKDSDAIYISRMITDNVTGTLENFVPDYPDDKFDNNTSMLLLHDKVKFSISKQHSPQFEWTIETVESSQLLVYPRQRYIGLILPMEKTNETQKEIEYSALVIEPILDPKTFFIDM